MKQALFIFKNKIKAGALSYVTGLSLVIFMLLMIPFILDRYGYREINQLNQRLQLNDKLASAINLLELGFYTIEYETMREILVFNNEPPINCFVEKWGLFDLVHLYTPADNFSDSLTLLSSDRILLKDSLCLYMVDNKNYLSVTGDSHIEGKCYLPAFGVVKAYIEGLHYTSDTVIYGVVDTASAILPKLKQSLEERYTTLFVSEQSSFNELPDSLCNEYTNQTMLYHFDDDIYIGKHYLKGKIIVSSNATITISEKSELDGCIIVANHIVVESEFKGNLQMFARDSIIIQDNCKLLYPSVLFVNKGEDVSIKIGKNGFICGMTILNGDSKEDCFLEIGDNTIVEGQIYNRGTTSAKGEIWGEIHTNHFSYKTEYSSYKDLLLNVTINKSLVSTEFVGISLFEDVNTKISIACTLK